MTDHEIADALGRLAEKARQVHEELGQARAGLEDCIAELRRTWNLDRVVPITDEQRREFARQRKTFFVKREPPCEHCGAPAGQTCHDCRRQNS